jgi:uncharacterized protein (TIGR04255 family)
VQPRPADLPEFRKPPLAEVVLGVQFSPPQGYQQILAGEVWNLFRAKYPKVQDRQPLLPVFETFGLPSAPSPLGPSVQMQMLGAAQHDRFWFSTFDETELLQFQQDRLLHNWKRLKDGANEYPRFEAMAAAFDRELGQLEGYVDSLAKQTLHITQCEITYINHIGTGSPAPLLASDWLRTLAFEAPVQADDFSLTFRQEIRDEEARPAGRLTVEAMTAVKADRTPTIVLNITARGAPKEPTLRSAMTFINGGRELIVRRFAQLTTEQAHKLWERVK